MGPVYRKASFGSIRANCSLYLKRRDYPAQVPHCVFYVIGSPRERAEHLFHTIYKYVDISKVKLRWWNEEPPSYGLEDKPISQWQGYSPERSCFVGLERASIHDASSHNVILLYYRNGHDPALIMEEAFRGEYHLFSSDLLIVPVAEYIFDRTSAEKVLTSKQGIVHHIRTRRGCYFAPIPVQSFEWLLAAEIYWGGNGKCLLGEIDIKRHTCQKDPRQT